MAPIDPTPPKPWLVVSDLDGTILDHWNYSAAAMTDTLQQLEARAIPVVFNTSKTAAELLPLRQRLKNHHPFIVENGSAIYLPQGYFSHSIAEAEIAAQHERIVLGSPREQLQQWLSTFEAGSRDLVSFVDMSAAEVAELTGMDIADAALARQREFSEVVRWRGSDAARQRFRRAAAEAGFATLQGGRFLHLLGNSDKGVATQRLQEEYQKHYGKRPSLIVCGDGANDVEMLRVADLALIVRSTNHDLPVVDRAKGRIMITHEPGPAGLALLFRELLLSGSH